MLLGFIIDFCHSMDLNSTTLEGHGRCWNLESEIFYYLFYLAKKIRFNHNINIKSSSWPCINS